MFRKVNFTNKLLLVAAIVGFIVYFVLLEFSEYWLGILTQHQVGPDFYIYFTAYLRTLAGENPYLPYHIGSSFVSHPFVLSFVSLFSWHQEGYLAIFFWVVTSAILWVFVVQLVFHVAIDDTSYILGRQENYQYWHGGMLLIFLGFAPFWETIHIGQINVFVMLALILTYYFSERNSDLLAGFFLALSTVLKTSPIIFVLYFVALRRFKVVGSFLMAFIAFSLIPAIQFSPGVLADFWGILSKLGGEINPIAYNQSALSLLARLFDRWGWEYLAALKWAHKVIMAAFAGAVLVLVALGDSEKRSRLWGFALLLMIMTLSSPLVWYHHSLFLVLPLMLFLWHPGRRYAILGVAVLFVIQSERLFEYKVANFAWPISLAEFILLGVGIWLYWNDWRRSRQPESLVKS